MPGIIETPFVGQIMMVAFPLLPRNFLPCNGQSLTISSHPALFSVIGVRYGGNGTTTFFLPNLQGRVPVHFGTGFALGASAGEESHVLALTELPSHGHVLAASDSPVDSPTPVGAFLTNSGKVNYGTTGSINTTLSSAMVVPRAGGQAHENRSPYLVVNFIICHTGVFPIHST
jgi:microcystin-dependent protein